MAGFARKADLAAAVWLPVRHVEIREARQLSLLDGRPDVGVRQLAERVQHRQRLAARQIGIERRVECATRRECQESVLTRSQEVLHECAVERADRVELVQVDAAEEIAPECSNVASLHGHVPQDLARDSGAHLVDVRLFDALVHTPDDARQARRDLVLPAFGRS